MSAELSVGLFTGMAAAMVVPALRRSVPRWIEALIWLGLIVSCWLALTNFEPGNVRHLTESVAWGADKIVNTMVGLLMAGALGWTVDHRFAIANLVVLLVGADILLLLLLRSHRECQRLQPRIMLGEWLEVPLHFEPVMAPVPSAIDEWNRRAERAAAVFAANFLMRLVQLLNWTGDVLVSQARRVFAEHRSSGALTNEQVGNIRALLSAQSIGWYGPIVPAPADVAFVNERQEDESDRLAS